jgi:hypothetical protein
MKNKTKIRYSLTDGHMRSIMIVVSNNPSPRLQMLSGEAITSLQPVYTIAKVRFDQSLIIL